MSPLVALNFALHTGPRKDDAAVWGLVPSRLNKASSFASEETFVLSGAEARSLLRAGMEKGPPVDDVLAVMGQDVDL